MPHGGGPVRELSLSGRNFIVAGDSEGNRILGGDQNTIVANRSGSEIVASLQKEIVAWKDGPFNVLCDDENGDQEFLQELADRNVLFPIVIVYWDGVVFNGTGQIIDEIAKSSKTGLTPITLSGTGKYKKQ